MAISFRCFAILAALLAGGPVLADQWFPLDAPGASSNSPQVEIDLDTVRAQGGGESVIRVTYDVLQPQRGGSGYRSFVGVVQFDCLRRDITLTSAVFYALPAGAGERLGRVGAETPQGVPPHVFQSIPASTRQVLLKAACPPLLN